MKTKKRKIRICRYCRLRFKTKADLKRHYEDNLWESCIQKTGKKYVCQVCKRKFESVKKFRIHWDTDHDDEALGLKFMEAAGKKKGPSTWTMRPVEKELIIDRLRSDKSKKALKQDYLANDLLMEEMEYGVADRAMTIVEILGIPSSIHEKEPLYIRFKERGVYERLSIGDLYKRKDEFFQIPALDKQSMKMSFQDAYVSKKKITEPILNIKLSNGRMVKATANHKFLIETKNGFEFVYGRDLKVGDFLPYDKQLPFNMIYEDIEILGNQYELDYDLGCLFGLFISEGSTKIRKRKTGGTEWAVRFSNGNYNIVNYYISVLERFGRYIGVYVDKRDGNAEVALYNKELTCWFREQFGENSHTKQIPSWCFSAPEEFRKGLLVGMFLGDGSITKCSVSSYTSEYSTVSEELYHNTQFLLMSFGLSYAVGIKKRKEKTDVYRIRPDMLSIGRIVEWVSRDIRISRGWGMKIKSRFSRLDMIPLITENLVVPDGEKVGRMMATLRGESKRGKGENRLHIKNVLDNVSYKTPYLDRLETMVNGDISWSRIKSIEVAEEQPEWVYDIHVDNNDNFMLANGMIIGNSGKSLLGLTCARHLQTLWKNHLDSLWHQSPELFARITDSRDDDGKPKYYMPTIRIGFNMQQTTEHVRNARMGDVVIQDEDPALAGYEARSIQNQIENLLKILRKACVNMIFISPVQVTYISVPTMVLEVIAKDIERRLTAAALYDRQHNAHGWIMMEILKEDDPLLAFYIREKDRNIEIIKESSGRESVVINQAVLMRDAEKLYKFLLSLKFDPAEERISLDFLKGTAMLAGIKGSVNYVEMVARYLHKSLARSPTFVITEDGYIAPSVPDRIVTSDDEFVIELEEVIEDPEILEHIYLSTEQALTNREVRGERHPRKLHVEYMAVADGERKFISKHAEAWYLVYVKGYTMQAVADALAHFTADGTLTDSAIANGYKNGGWRAIYQEEISGEAAELAVKNMLFPEWEVVGGQGRPDIVNPEDETWIEVKCRSRLRPKEPVESQITDFEYEHAREGKPMKLIRIGYVPEKARIEIWNVSINPDWIQKDIDVELDMMEDEDSESV